jgi:polysaccharide export outer membrane protein
MMFFFFNQNQIWNSSGQNKKVAGIFVSFANPKYLLQALIAVVLFQCTACTGSQKLAYMSNLADTTSGSLSKAINTFESPIMKNDQLWITVGGTNLEDLALLNSGSGIIQGSNFGSNSGNNITPVLGYLVEGDGTIKLPYLGKIVAEGQTRMQLETTLTQKFKDYTKNPIVNIRFLNYRVTVLGAVNNPGTFIFPNERMTVLEALGLAGDLTLVGKREDVLVIREINGVRNFGRINLLTKDIFNSPYYYLKTNDVVYIAPTSASSIQRERLPQYIGMIAGILSLVTTFIYVLK